MKDAAFASHSAQFLPHIAPSNRIATASLAASAESDFGMLAKPAQSSGGRSFWPQRNQQESLPEQALHYSSTLSDGDEVATDFSDNMQVPDVKNNDAPSPPQWTSASAEWSDYSP